MTIRLITLDPGHFHAALLQKEMFPQVDPRVHLYAPLGPDLLAHLQRIQAFNLRDIQPTAWEMEVHASADFYERYRQESPGNVVVLSGRNQPKIGYIEAALDAGLHVLADKPWIISSADLPRLAAVLAKAEERGLIAYDIMTERFEITSILQRELINDPAIFGTIDTGSQDKPAVEMTSMHYLMKHVAGQPLRRPPWFFDIKQQGEGLTDVGTHLVDLVPWMLWPGEGVAADNDLVLHAAKRWPTVLSLADFQRVTGEREFPPYLQSALQAGELPYFCNTLVEYQLRGVPIKLDIRWDFEAATGTGDTHFAAFRGTQATVEIRQGAEQNFRPELYVIPNSTAVREPLQQRVAEWQMRWPGVTLEETAEHFWIKIPDVYRVGHEAHFGEVAQQFFRYVADPRSLPAWERPNMLAKYAVTTRGVELAGKRGTP